MPNTVLRLFLLGISKVYDQRKSALEKTEINSNSSAIPWNGALYTTTLSITFELLFIIRMMFAKVGYNLP